MSATLGPQNRPSSKRPRLGWARWGNDSHAGGVTTRIGFAIIGAGVALVVLRWLGVLDTEVADIASVMAIVLGALAVAIDGEDVDQKSG